MKNYVQPGEVADITPSADVASGDVVVIGARIAIAATAIKANQTGSGSVVGVHKLPKATGAIGQFALVYWDATAKKITTTSSGNTLAGYAFQAAQSADATVPVKINA